MAPSFRERVDEDQPESAVALRARDREPVPVGVGHLNQQATAPNRHDDLDLGEGHPAVPYGIADQLGRHGRDVIGEFTVDGPVLEDAPHLGTGFGDVSSALGDTEGVAAWGECGHGEETP
jgi:hypothetical protein